jgi:hypothetical protein
MGEIFVVFLGIKLHVIISEAFIGSPSVYVCAVNFVALSLRCRTIKKLLVVYVFLSLSHSLTLARIHSEKLSILLLFALLVHSFGRLVWLTFVFHPKRNAKS